MKLNTWLSKRNIKESAAHKAPVRDTLIKTEDILEVLIQLSKAMDAKDMKKLFKDHQPSQSKIVDHTYHVANSKVPKAYQKMVANKSSVTKSPEILNGLSSKVIHKAGDDMFMTKPYMSSRDLPRELPISGWGIMAVHNLYHAGNIGELVENVHTTTLKDPPYQPTEFPVTVHHFAKGYTEAVNLDGGGPLSRTAPATKPADTTTSPEDDEPMVPMYENVQRINPMHSRQIGLMDWLTGNFDRHSGNLMVGNTDDGSGHKPLLAIDHDRAFYYNESASEPKHSYAKSSMARHLGEGATENTTDHDHHLANWWHDNKHQIYGEMNRNLQSLKDDNIRKYIRNNFDERFKTVTDWADNFKEGKKGLFHDDSIRAKYHPLNLTDNGQVDSVIESLPEDKVSGMEMLTDLFKERREPDKRATIKHAILKLSKDMNPKELVRFYSRLEHEPELKDTKSDVLMDMKADLDKYGDHLAEIVKTNKALPAHSKFLNPFWEKHIEDALTDHHYHENLSEAN